MMQVGTQQANFCNYILRNIMTTTTDSRLQTMATANQVSYSKEQKMVTKLGWLAKYYPISASECPEKEAIAHSLCKWQGLSDKPDEGIPIVVDDRTCALCYHYHVPETSDPDDNPDPENGCESCPIFVVNGVTCKDSPDQNIASPWEIWRLYKNPEPMIQLLQKTLNEYKYE